MTSEREVLTWDGFGAAGRELAQQVADSGYLPDLILTIARGGLKQAADTAPSDRIFVAIWRSLCLDSRISPASFWTAGLFQAGIEVRVLEAAVAVPLGKDECPADVLMLYRNAVTFADLADIPDECLNLRP